LSLIIVVLLRETSVLELPRTSATIIIKSTAPPTIHTQGWVYHSVVVVVVSVVVTLLLETVLSCAHTKVLIRLNKKTKKIFLQIFFIMFVLMKNKLSEYSLEESGQI
jgi:hypothetical protein